MAKKKDTVVTDDDLINAIYSTINKDEKRAYSLGENSEWAPTDIVDWISTGNEIIDMVISNRIGGGIPGSKIIEVQGQKSSGKSLLLEHLIVSVQKQNGICVYFDTEQAFDRSYARAIGIDLDKLIYVDDNILENIFLTIDDIIEQVRSKDSNKQVLIMIDSIMGATTLLEDEEDYENKGYATAKSKLLSKAMRKINSKIGRHKITLVMTNQLRASMAMFGDAFTTSGGAAIGFHASLILRLTKLGMIKNADKRVVGTKNMIKVMKSRIGPSYQTVEYETYFDRGMDIVKTWFEAGKESKALTSGKKVILKGDAKEKEIDTSAEGFTFDETIHKTKVVKNSYCVKGDTLYRRFGPSNFKEVVLDNPELKEMLLEGLKDFYIMKYYDPKHDSSLVDQELTLEDDSGVEIPLNSMAEETDGGMEQGLASKMMDTDNGI